jgi:hypothetical protein
MAASNMHNLTTLIKRYVKADILFLRLGYRILHIMGREQERKRSTFHIPIQVLMRTTCRLEAATSRLEDMAQATIDPAALTGLTTSTSKALSPAINGTGAESIAHPAAAARTPDPLPPAIEDFDELINQDVSKFVNLSEELGGLVAKQVSSVVLVKSKSSFRDDVEGLNVMKANSPSSLGLDSLESLCGPA